MATRSQKVTVCERSFVIGRISGRRPVGVRNNSALALESFEKLGTQREHIRQEGSDMQPTINREIYPTLDTGFAGRTVSKLISSARS